MATILRTRPRAELWRHALAVRAVAVSHDGTRVLTGSTDSTALLLDITRRRGPVLVCAVFLGHLEAVSAVALPPAASHLALTGSLDHTARIWDTETGAEVHVLRGHELSVRAVALAHRLAASASNYTIRLWDTATGELARVLQGTVSDLAFATDARFLVACSRDGSVRLWPLAQEPSRIILAQASPIENLALGPDEHVLALTSSHAKAFLWRGFDADPAPPPVELHRHPRGVNGVALAPAWCVTACWDGPLRVFAVRTGALLGELPTPSDVQGVVLSPRDPKVLVSVHDDGAARVWRLWGDVEEAALATMGSPAWRRLWWRDGDNALWARVLSFAGPFE
jgi:WD40 repeat protein